MHWLNIDVKYFEFCCRAGCTSDPPVSCLSWGAYYERRPEESWDESYNIMRYSSAEVDMINSWKSGTEHGEITIEDGALW